MILRCLCGAAYSLKDEPVKLGESFECEECGGEVSVPPLHGVIPDEGMVTLEDQSPDSDQRTPTKPRLTNPILSAPTPTAASPTSPLTDSGRRQQNAAEVRALLDRLEKLSRDNITLHLKVARLEKELAEPGGSRLDEQSKDRDKDTTRQHPDFGALREEFFSGLKSLSSGLVELKQAWVDHAAHGSDHEPHNETLAEELSHSKHQIEKLTTLQSQISNEKEARISDLEQELDSLRDEVSRLTRSRAKQIKERNTRIAKLEKTLEATRKEVVDLVTERDEQLGERDARIASLEQELEALASRMKSRLLGLVEQLDCSDEPHDGEAAVVTDTRDKQIAALQAMLRAFNSSVEKTTNQNEQLLMSSTSVGSELRKVTRAIAELMNRVEALASHSDGVAPMHGPKRA